VHLLFVLFRGLSPARCLHLIAGLVVGFGALAIQAEESVKPSESGDVARPTAISRKPVSAEDVHDLAVSTEDLSSTERRLIGTWQGSLPKDSGPIGRYTVSLNADGTYRLDALIKTTAEGPVVPSEVVNLGRWSASRGLYTTVITQAGDGKPLDLSKAAFTAVYAIRTISDDTFVFQSIASGDTYTLARIQSISAGN
jgi:hypothetical protein